MMIYKNSNGKDYEVIERNTLLKIAILKPLKPTFTRFPYMVAKGFDISKTSWDKGIYDMTLESAQECFNDIRF